MASQWLSPTPAAANCSTFTCPQEEYFLQYIKLKKIRMWLLLSPLQMIVSTSLSHRVQIQYHQIYSTWRQKIWHWILMMKNHILKLSWGPEKYSLSALQEILCASSILLWLTFKKHEKKKKRKIPSEISFTNYGIIYY